MNDTLHLSFFEATREVFKLMLDLQKISGSTIASGEDTCGNLTISIGVTSNLTRDILHTFPEETIPEMIRIMTGGTEVNEVDDFVTPAIGEISDIVSGRVMIVLSEKDVTCDILPPKTIKSGEDVCAYPVDSNTKISTEIGSVGLEVRLQSKWQHIIQNKVP